MCILKTSKSLDVFLASRDCPMHLPLRASRALQELNIIVVAPLTSSDVYPQARITIGLRADYVMGFWFYVYLHVQHLSPS